jgi:hypothetical protein
VAFFVRINMNANCLLLSLLGIFSMRCPALAQSGPWHRTAIADSVTLDFPVEPTRHDVVNTKAYGVYEEGVLYSVNIQQNAFDAQATLTEKQEMYGGALEGAAERCKAPRVFNKTSFIVNGFEGVEGEFNPTVSKLTTPVHMRVVLVNGTFYGLLFSASPSAAHTAARQRFFASFVPRMQPVTSTPAETRTIAYKIGKLLGSLFFYGLLAGGAFLLLKRLNASGKSKPVI